MYFIGPKYHCSSLSVPVQCITTLQHRRMDYYPPDTSRNVCARPVPTLLVAIHS